MNTVKRNQLNFIAKKETEDQLAEICKTTKRSKTSILNEIDAKPSRRKRLAATKIDYLITDKESVSIF